MSNELSTHVFENFPAIRSLAVNGETLFIAKDVAVSLGYSDPGSAVRQHCKRRIAAGALHPPIEIVDSLGRIQSPNLITESDLYRLIFKSGAQHAERFQDWMVEEVLPSIRKHGMYATSNTIEEMLSDPQAVSKMLTALQEEQKKRVEEQKKRVEEQKKRVEAQEQAKVQEQAKIAAQRTVEIKEAKIEQQEPWVAMARAFDPVGKGVLVRDVAKILAQEGFPIGCAKLWELLKEHRWTTKIGTPTATSTAVERKIMVVTNTEYTNPITGRKSLNMTARMTPRGVASLMKCLPKWGIKKAVV